MANIIDAHHHLWRYTQKDYGWIGPEMEVLKRDFLLEDLGYEIATAGMEGTVVVQARQSLEETRWLLECSATMPAILGVVGWLPLENKNFPSLLKDFRGGEKLKGVRHVVQDEPSGFLRGVRFNAGVETLPDAGLSYDLLIRDTQLPEAVEFCRRHPNLRIVLDHMAKPQIAAGNDRLWAKELRRLAECPNVFCKVSGLVTEADWQAWKPSDLRAYLEVALKAFGAERLMAGSDWPVCLVATSYKRWWSTLFDWSSEAMDRPSQAKFLGQNAREFYRLGNPAL